MTRSGVRLPSAPPLPLRAGVAEGLDRQAGGSNLSVKPLAAFVGRTGVGRRISPGRWNTMKLRTAAVASVAGALILFAGAGAALALSTPPAFIAAAVAD